MKITEAMVYTLNEELEYRGYPFCYKYDDSIIKGNPCIKISLPRMKGVHSFTINLTEEFFDWLERVLNKWTENVCIIKFATN